MTSTDLTAAFAQAFGSSAGPVHVVRAPGRVNLIGEHIDYCGLPVLPMALRQSVRLAFHPRADCETRLVNRDARFAPSAFAVKASIPAAPAGDWGNYARAAAQALAQRFPDLRGVDAMVESDLPIAAGLSSSSAVVVAMAPALLHANRRMVAPLELMELLARGERYVGTAGGGGAGRSRPGGVRATARRLASEFAGRLRGEPRRAGPARGAGPGGRRGGSAPHGSRVRWLDRGAVPRRAGARGHDRAARALLCAARRCGRRGA